MYSSFPYLPPPFSLSLCSFLSLSRKVAMINVRLIFMYRCVVEHSWLQKKIGKREISFSNSFHEYTCQMLVSKWGQMESSRLSLWNTFAELLLSHLPSGLCSRLLQPTGQAWPAAAPGRERAPTESSPACVPGFSRTVCPQLHRPAWPQDTCVFSLVLSQQGYIYPNPLVPSVLSNFLLTAFLPIILPVGSCL